MMKLTGKAFAKLNLTLDILSSMPNGYHNIETIFQSVSLCDIITLENGCEKISVSCSNENIPEGEDNICYQAAEQFFKKAGIKDGVSIHIEKNIPEAAGLGGGSADAAATLKMLNEAYDNVLTNQELLNIAANLGADVPFCLVGGTQLARGIGEALSRLSPCPDCDIILIKQGTKPSTAALYKLFDEAGGSCHPDTAAEILALKKGDISLVAKYVRNCFAPLWSENIAEIKDRMLQIGALTAELSGSGPTVFSIFKKGTGEKAKSLLQIDYRNIYLCNPVESGVKIISKLEV